MIVGRSPILLPAFCPLKGIKIMKKELRRAVEIKANFQLADDSEEMELYSRILHGVYSCLRKGKPNGTYSSISENFQSPDKLRF